MFQYRISHEDQSTTIYFEGDMDIDTTEIIEDEMIPALQSYEAVHINFGKVPFVDSTGIGLLIKLVQQLKENGTSVTIHSINPDVFEVFSLLQIPDILGEDVFID